jgi:alkanesulfonate monooxygenase SsuD/methylene tetrahydromethanopterin reductase-like flavin-dependent oxidoreductase (luciferase family)
MADLPDGLMALGRLSDGERDTLWAKAHDHPEKTMINFTMSFDMRVPDLGTPAEEIYAATLDMCAYADEAGLPYVNIMEHHSVEDGYMPQPLIMAAAVAARTKQMRLFIGALILPLHDPIEIAEQMAVVDLISKGRLDVCFGAGYVKSEFNMFGRAFHERGKMLDEYIPVIQRALQGERFVYNGREVYVTPRPVQKPYPRIYGGGGVEASAKRAARLGIGFMPMNPTLVPMYKEEAVKHGNQPGPVYTGLNWLHISETPEKTRKEVEPHLFHYATSYAKFAESSATASPFQGLKTVEDVWKSGILLVVTPEEAAKMALDAQKYEGRFSIMPLIGGLSPKVGWKSLELLVKKVLPMIAKAQNKS